MPLSLDCLGRLIFANGPINKQVNTGTMTSNDGTEQSVKSYDVSNDVTSGGNVNNFDADSYDVTSEGNVNNPDADSRDVTTGNNVNNFDADSHHLTSGSNVSSPDADPRDVTTRGNGHVTLYDSTVRLHYKHKTREVRYNVALEKYAATLCSDNADNLTIQVADLEQVKKDNDSGIAAIIHAIKLAKGLDPQSIKFNYKSLRQTLINDLSVNTFENIEKYHESPRHHKGHKYEIEVALYCTCRMLDLGNQMISCKSCEKWYHWECVGLSEENITWSCNTCQTNSELNESEENEEDSSSVTNMTEFKKYILTILRDGTLEKTLNEHRGMKLPKVSYETFGSALKNSTKLQEVVAVITKPEFDNALRVASDYIYKNFDIPIGCQGVDLGLYVSMKILKMFLH
eukprot:gene10302-11365_t